MRVLLLLHVHFQNLDGMQGSHTPTEQCSISGSNPGPYYGFCSAMEHSLMAGSLVVALLLLLIFVEVDAYAPGDYVPLSRRGQYHNMRTPWHDQLGRHCPRFGIDREVVLPIPKPVGYTGSDPYKISLQIGKEKFNTPWLFLIGRQGKAMPIIDITLRHAGGDLLGITAKIVDMPEQYATGHEEIFKEFWDPAKWPKHVLVRYEWEEKSEIDVATGFYILFGSAFLSTLVTSIYILQSSKEKLSRFVKENVIDASVGIEEPKVE